MATRDYFSELNEPQRLAVQTTEGPVMIIAGAGSGKTRVLTYRIAHLLEKGVDPFNILALTFTNKAAREMKDRIAGIVGGTEARNLWMGTFHSVFAKILRFEAEKLGYPSNFTIYDTDDSKSLIKTILKEEGLDDKIYKPGAVLNRISAAKSSLISPMAYVQNEDIQNEDRMMNKPKLGILYQKYASRCFKAGAMDFDDLLYKTNVLLRDFPDVLHKYQHKFKYILVDEYQDTNYSQYIIVKKLAAVFENICVVGDDAQSIYGFRGANIQNILNFEKDYPDLKTFKLEQNYRSTKTIVEAANSIIARNRDQLKKTVWTDNDEGHKVKVARAMSDNEEGALIANAIFEYKMNEQRKNADFAILYRTNAQSRSIEEALRKLNIHYRIYGGLSFYQRKEIKDLLAYFRLATNPADEEALKRVINYPTRGIGKTTVDKLVVAASDRDASIWEVMTNPMLQPTDINKGTWEKLGNFITMIRSFNVSLKKQPAYALAEHIAQSSTLLKDLYSDKSTEGISRYENVQELLNAIKEFDESPAVDENGELHNRMRTLDEFIQDIALLTDADEKDKDNIDKVSLMTIHAAKGLEFPYVFVSGMEENLFPSQLSLNSRADLEEERRLFYVAITRAETQLHLSYAISRYRWGNLIHCEPSRFLEEIDPEHLEFSNVAESRQQQQSFAPKEKTVWKRKEHTDTSFGNVENFKKATKSTPTPVFTKPNLSKASSTQVASKPVEPDQLELIQKLQVGMQVEHEKFGQGKVLQIEGIMPNTKATVFFPEVGQKQLLLKFAKLRITTPN